MGVEANDTIIVISEMAKNMSNNARLQEEEAIQFYVETKPGNTVFLSMKSGWRGGVLIRADKGRIWGSSLPRCELRWPR